MSWGSHEGSAFIRHEPCPECGSSDANAVYDDGHTYCFSCESHGDSDGEVKKAYRAEGLVQGEATGLPSRKIDRETCAFFGYVKAEYQGETFYAAPYYDDRGRMVAQKLRGKGKDFRWIGTLKPIDVLPFGAHKWHRTGKQIVVTEGEIDTLAMSQVQGNKWPVVSIPTGAGAKVTRRFFARHLEYFEGFDKVVLMFDQDEAGQEATEAAAQVLGVRAAVAVLTENDPSDMLKKGLTGELLSAMWRAKTYRPDGIVDLHSLKEDVLKEPEPGLSWPFKALTDHTYGIRLGELYALGAGTGVGKTDLYTQIIAHMIQKHHVKVGVFALEQEPKETATRIMGKLASRPFHIPDADWDMTDLESAWDSFSTEGRIFLYDSFGMNDWDLIKSKIRYLRDAEDVRYFFLDHLTALAAGEEDERQALQTIMAEMGGLVKEKPVTNIMFVSHLATPKGTPHEEGGRVMIRHFFGSRAIGYWSHFMFGLERDQQNDDPRIRTTTTFRILKDRYTGRSTGQKFYLGYDPDTGLQYETEAPDQQDGRKYGFLNETEGGGEETENDF